MTSYFPENIMQYRPKIFSALIIMLPQTVSLVLSRTQGVALG